MNLKLTMILVLGSCLVLILIYYAFLLYRTRHLEKLFFEWNEKLKIYIEHRIENNYAGEKIVIYYTQFYLIDTNKYLMKIRFRKEEDFIEDILLHDDVNRLDKLLKDREEMTEANT
jgi:hypothetical protein